MNFKSFKDCLFANIIMYLAADLIYEKYINLEPIVDGFMYKFFVVCCISFTIMSFGGLILEKRRNKKYSK